MRGLKHGELIFIREIKQSHPLRVRGLKLKRRPYLPRLNQWSHPLRVRGLKLRRRRMIRTWSLSHPLRVRGLKPVRGARPARVVPVASFTGAWIETKEATILATSEPVASFTGAWIETSVSVGSKLRSMSHPLRVRGLKQSNA